MRQDNKTKMRDYTIDKRNVKGQHFGLVKFPLPWICWALLALSHSGPEAQLHVPWPLWTNPPPPHLSSSSWEAQRSAAHYALIPPQKTCHGGKANEMGLMKTEARSQFWDCAGCTIYNFSMGTTMWACATVKSQDVQYQEGKLTSRHATTFCC